MPEGDRKFVVFLHELRKHCFMYGELHRRASETYARRATKLTVINLVASIAILFVSANKGMHLGIGAITNELTNVLGWSVPSGIDVGELLISTCGAIVVATAALHYLMKYEERNLIHKYVAVDYENLYRKCGRYVIKSALTDEDIHKINKQLNAVARHSPPISTHILTQEDRIALKWKEVQDSSQVSVLTFPATKWDSKRSPE